MTYYSEDANFRVAHCWRTDKDTQNLRFGPALGSQRQQLSTYWHTWARPKLLAAGLGITMAHALLPRRPRDADVALLRPRIGRQASGEGGVRVGRWSRGLDKDEGGAMSSVCSQSLQAASGWTKSQSRLLRSIDRAQVQASCVGPSRAMEAGM